MVKESLKSKGPCEVFRARQAKVLLLSGYAGKNHYRMEERWDRMWHVYLVPLALEEGCSWLHIDLEHYLKWHVVSTDTLKLQR